MNTRRNFKSMHVLAGLSPYMGIILIWVCFYTSSLQAQTAKSLRQQFDPEKRELIDVCKLRVINPKHKVQYRDSKTSIEVPDTICGEILLEARGPRFVYSLSDCRLIEKGIDLSICPACSVGFDGQSYWLACFRRTDGKTTLERPSASAVFAFDSAILAKPVPQEISNILKADFASFEELLRSYAFLEDLRRQLGVRSFSNDELEAGLGQYAMAEKVRPTEDTPLGAPTVRFQVRGDAEFTWWFVSGNESLGGWRALLQCDKDPTYCINRLRLQPAMQTGGMGTGKLTSRMAVSALHLEVSHLQDKAENDVFTPTSVIGDDTLVLRFKQ